MNEKEGDSHGGSYRSVITGPRFENLFEICYITKSNIYIKIFEASKDLNWPLELNK